jgi:hypothetical protein
MILRFLGIQGIAGIAVSLALAILLVIQKGETRHWRKQSASFEQLYSHEQAAFAETVADYRASAEQARAADKAAAQRVAADQRAINQRTTHDFESRLADVRARAERLRLESAGAADSGARRTAPVSALSAAARSADQATNQDRLPPADALTATEQAIQLDELIKWVGAQAKVDNNPAAVASPGDDARH